VRNIYIILLLLFSYSTLLAQNSIDELSLIKEQTFAKHEYDKRRVSYIFKESKNFIIKYNPLSLTFGGLLFLYQKAISPQISVNCPYEISCSNFSKQCIQHYGLLKGVALTADRLTRCTQFTLIDLKPIQFNKKNKIIDPIEQYSLRQHAH
jgi:putative component of membrane protein insertase Oxa1/YidC/SpoIIIJ protein YidD